MSPRYILVIGSGPANKPELLERYSSRTGLKLVFSNQRMALLANSACHWMPCAAEGCILGTLFHRHGAARRLHSLAVNEAKSVVSSDGQVLLNTFWGGYVAAIARPDSVRILRDPSGVFPCYFSTSTGFNVFASDAELLLASGVKDVSVDLEEIGRQLYRAFVPVASTALCGIQELLPGFGLRQSSGIHHQEPCWSPWNYISCGETNADEHAERLGRIVAHCVHAWAASRRRILLSVSGGLDSSILAACLAKCGADTVCLSMFTDDPKGDERAYARELCGLLKLQLLERPYRLEDIDILEPLAANLPRPRDRTQANAYERVHLEVALKIGADAFMTGNGGDHVFGYSQSAAPVIDRYLSQGLTKGVCASLLDVCHQTGCSLFDALRHAWRLARASPVFQVTPNPLFLDSKFIAGLGPNNLQHPWLDAPTGALPGKAAHIASILRAQPTLEASRGSHLPVLSPLMSQPIVETCLQIPSWEWRAGGRDRSVARSAFARELPASVLRRRTKGTPGHFASRLLDHFRFVIRERLLGGHLACHGIIDTLPIAHVLASERPIPDLQRVRILELVNAEAWIDHWASRMPSGATV